MEEPNRLDAIVHSARQAIAHENLYAALCIALTLPDMCGTLETPEITSVGERYRKWFDKWAVECVNEADGHFLAPIITAEDCWQLRNAILHAGTGLTGRAGGYTVIDEFVFVPGSSTNYLTRVEGNVVDGRPTPNRIIVNAAMFVTNMLVAVEKFRHATRNDADIQERISRLFTITYGPISLHAPLPGQTVHAPPTERDIQDEVKRFREEFLSPRQAGVSPAPGEVFWVECEEPSSDPDGHRLRSHTLDPTRVMGAEDGYTALRGWNNKFERASALKSMGGGTAGVYFTRFLANRCGDGDALPRRAQKLVKHEQRKAELIRFAHLIAEKLSDVPRLGPHDSRFDDPFNDLRRMASHVYRFVERIEAPDVVA